MTEQPKNFWQLIWNPQGKVKRKLTMLWWCGWVLWTAGWFATFTGKHTEDTIINLYQYCSSYRCPFCNS
jgi:hypothetical protein